TQLARPHSASGRKALWAFAQTIKHPHSCGVHAYQYVVCTLPAPPCEPPLQSNCT
ncbi:hypothetical protein OG21DRAFT_1515325, partial [Imleria badia]